MSLPSASTVCSAPRSEATASASRFRSTATTRAPSARAIITTLSPTPPAPTTVTHSPSVTRARPDQGAVRRGEPASETRRGSEVDLLRETHQIRVGSVQDDVLGERSPVREAWLLLSRTDLSVPGPTPLAPTAAAHERDRHPIPDPPSADLLTDLGHHPGKLMTRHMRENDLLVARPRVPIATAHSRRHHPDHNPADRGRGLGYLPNLRLGSNGIQDHGAHRYSLSGRSHRVIGWWLRLQAMPRTPAPRRARSFRRLSVTLRAGCAGERG